MFLKQSTAVVIPFGPFVDKTDGVTLETGLVSALDHASTGIMLSKNGGTLAVRHASVTASSYDAHGCYKVTLDTTDTGTLGSLRVIYTDAATCVAVWQDFQVVPANVYDSLVGGSDNLQVDAVQWLGTACATPTVAGVPEVDLTHVAGSTTSVAALATNADAILTDTADMQPKLGTPAGASISADIAAVKSQTAAIETDTQDIQSRLPAALTGDGNIKADALKINGSAPGTQQTGDAYARLGAPAGASVSADIAAVKTQTAAIETDTQDIQTRIPAALVGGRMDATVDGTGMESGATAAIAAAVQAGTVIYGTADSGASTTVIPVKTLDITLTDADQLKGRLIMFEKSTATVALQGQGAPITASSTTDITVTAAFTTAPSEDDVFRIL